MDPLAERIDRRDVLLVDGAMGTMLMDSGLEPGQCPESLNLSQPERLKHIAEVYLAAGADILETNTFGASPLKLSPYGLERETEAINLAAVNAVREVAGSRAYVAASCGPSGKLPTPYGDTEPDDIYRSFLRQMQCLVGAGVDAILVETMIDLSEACLAVRAAKEACPEIPVIASLTFDATPRGFYTIMGVSIEQAARELCGVGACAVGSNCGSGIESMVAIAEAFRKCTDLPLIIQSNAGLPDTSGGALVYDETAEYMAAKIPVLLDAGASILGGCCGTTPTHIRAYRATIDAATAVQ